MTFLLYLCCKSCCADFLWQFPVLFRHHFQIQLDLYVINDDALFQLDRKSRTMQQKLWKEIRTMISRWLLDHKLALELPIVVWIRVLCFLKSLHRESTVPGFSFEMECLSNCNKSDPPYPNLTRNLCPEPKFDHISCRKHFQPFTPEFPRNLNPAAGLHVCLFSPIVALIVGIYLIIPSQKPQIFAFARL